MSALLSPASNVPVVDSSSHFVHGVDYAFYNKIRTREAPNYYQQLLSSAQNRIVIWDPYFIPSVSYKVFESLKSSCFVSEILILTICKGSYVGKDFFEFAKNCFETLSDSLKGFSIMAYGMKNRQYEASSSYQKFHDRFLFVDNDVYLVGNSLDNQIDCKESFGICRLFNDADKDVAVNAFNDYWKQCNGNNSHKFSKTK